VRLGSSPSEASGTTVLERTTGFVSELVKE